MQYAENLVRSAMEPETMVAAVAQNTVWKISVRPVGSPRRHTPSAKKSKPPKNGLAAPNMMPKPRIQKIGVPMREIHQVLHDDVAGVLRTGEAGLNHRKAGLHEEYQRRCDERPAYVYRRSEI